MFKDKLKQLRINRNLTQADVAKAIGVSAATIGNYEQGTREPRNNEMWQKLADYFSVSVDYLMDKESSRYEKANIKTETASSSNRDWTQQYRTDIPIIYDDVDITQLIVGSNKSDINKVTRKQWYAYTDYLSRSGHVLYARRNLLDILNEIKSQSIVEITQNISSIVEQIEDNVIYWYKKCWNNIDDLFPTAINISTLYDLLNKCLCVDMVAEREFTLIPIGNDFDWLREKLR